MSTIETAQPKLSRRAFLVTAASFLAASCAQPQQGEIDSELPFRSIQDAITACTLRRLFARRLPHERISPLERLLDTDVSESSHIGIVNGHLQEETETLSLGNIAFAIKPWEFLFENGSERVPILGNTPNLTAFREQQDQTRLILG